jgi:hypothetical protein
LSKALRVDIKQVELRHIVSIGEQNCDGSGEP